MCYGEMGSQISPLLVENVGLRKYSSEKKKTGKSQNLLSIWKLA